MYDRETIVRLIKMIEKGNLRLGEKWAGVTTKKFRLEKIEEALEMAKKEASWGSQVILVP